MKTRTCSEHNVALSHRVARWKWLARCAVLTAALRCFLGVETGLAQNEPQGCEELQTDPKNGLRYKARTGRCEGLYIRRNSGGANLVLLALEERATSVPATVGDTMRLAWPSRVPLGVTVQQLNLRAAANPNGRHYQMDARRPVTAGVYDWPLDVLKAAKLSPSVVHLAAFTKTKVGATASELLYAPLRRGPRDAAATSYDFTLRPSQEVDDLKYAIQRLDGDRWSAVSAFKTASFGVGIAKRPFTVSIPRSEFNAGAAVYRVVFSAKLGEHATADPVNFPVVFFND